jgi:hypothetical protein
MLVNTVVLLHCLLLAHLEMVLECDVSSEAAQVSVVRCYDWRKMEHGLGHTHQQPAVLVHCLTMLPRGRRIIPCRAGERPTYEE